MGNFSIPEDSHDHEAIDRFRGEEDLQSLFLKAMSFPAEYEELNSCIYIP